MLAARWRRRSTRNGCGSPGFETRSPEKPVKNSSHGPSPQVVWGQAEAGNTSMELSEGSFFGRE